MVWLSAGFGLGCAVVMCALLRPGRSLQSVGVLTELHPAMASATARVAGGHVRAAALRRALAAA
ncbi:MAG: hypothetical protein ABWY29_11035 [Blastococcus sp.]